MNVKKQNFQVKKEKKCREKYKNNMSKYKYGTM